jgi:hypothetical protein
VVLTVPLSVMFVKVIKNTVLPTMNGKQTKQQSILVCIRMNMSEMTYEEWEMKYKPIPNHITGECCSFETYGDEVNFVASQDNHNVWTEMDGDNGVYLVNTTLLKYRGRKTMTYVSLSASM